MWKYEVNTFNLKCKKIQGKTVGLGSDENSLRNLKPFDFHAVVQLFAEEYF